ncbi:hypothetical protein ACGFIW_31435 [Micromonospora sp. NPDC048935]|uniref:hypothetical protein n=1 Tax=Micromonospora sp. NPDC048935 TaxID=3364262 RepID=UPI0037179523
MGEMGQYRVHPASRVPDVWAGGAIDRSELVFRTRKFHVRESAVQVRLSASWTDSGGTRWAPGDTIDVDAVTLAELEEQGMVEEPEGQGSGSGKTTTTSSSTSTADKPTDPKKIGPGPGAPPADDTDN